MLKFLILFFTIFEGNIEKYITKVEPQKHKLTILIPNLAVTKGHVRLILFNSADGFPADYRKAVLAKSYLVNSSSLQIEIPELPKGTYAVAAFHDENSNGKFDFNLVGVPKEGYGASNNARHRFGPPSFQEAMFEFNRDMAISFELKYWSLIK